ncbi:nSTAND1 domain-containing NTPase [Piscinibacter terrae]|uniref:OmpR/PhoB-type domain-containing protein n=1 Tax=Piscinibacter terrae TaxID=2496871 RepID=A0A3N7HIP4_9BURK|nr:winged helix-turn-helix domain-containing protein [Albitalea terrae]RQP21910.1 hypothetical protein DZC73_26080 [Albitalea terrae]
MSALLGEARPGLRDAAAVAEDSSAATARFMLGDWLVDVPTRRLHRGDEVVILEPRPMAVLAELCRHPGEVIGAEALLDACWPGEPLGDNPVHKVIAGLRRALQDSATAPRCIETIRKQGYRLVAPIRVLSEQGPRSLQGGWRDRSPFRGLESFGVEHSAVFFGRDDAVAELHARLAAQWQRGHPLVVLLGPSGSGKTSLVQAGLLPALLLPRALPDAAGQVPLLRACTAGSMELAAVGDMGPWSALAGALLDWDGDGVPLLAGYSIESLARALREQPEEVLRLLRVGLIACRMMGPDDIPVAPPLLVLDRLEALFQSAAQADASAFIDCIGCLVRSRLLLVLAVCRNDFYPSLAAHPALMVDKACGAHMDLAPPGADALAQMIRLPARAAGLVYGTDASGLRRLDDRLCDEALHARDALPMLQYTLQALYLDRAPGNELSWASYDALGGLEGAIGQRAEAVLAALPSARQAAFTHLLPRLVGLTTEDATPTSCWVAAASIANDDERAVLHSLVEARLLVADQSGGAAGFRVAHEALLRRWPRVTAWVAQHRTTLVARGELMPWVRRWVDGGRASALLLPRGTLLWQSVEAVAEAPHLFGGDEQQFVARSHARLKRQVQWRWAVSAGALALALIAASAALRSAHLARVASERESQSRRLASFMLGDLADQLRPIGKLDLLGRIGEQGLQLLSPRDVNDETAADTLQRAKALVVIGEVNSSRGKSRPDIASPALKRARDLLAPLEQASDLDAADFYKTLGASDFWLGQMAFDAGRLDEAAQQMARYREACERWLAARPRDPQARTELSFALGSLGSIELRRGAWGAASRWFQSSLAIKLAVLAEHPDDADAQDAVASARTWAGLLAYIQGEPSKALALFDAARAVQVSLAAQRPNESVRQRDLGTLEVRRAEALQALGRPADALQAWHQSVAWLARATGNDPKNLRWQAERLHAESGLLQARGRAGEAIDSASQSLRHRLSDRADLKTAHEQLWRQALLRVDLAEAESASRARDWPSTLHHSAMAALQLREVIAQRPSHWQGRELQAYSGLLTIGAHAAMGDLNRRTAACALTRDELQPAVDSGQSGLVLEAWLLARACSGPGDISEPELLRLGAGGYRPTAPGLLNLLNRGIQP